jgi:flagellar biosynthesis GTPase FlhF
MTTLYTVEQENTDVTPDYMARFKDQSERNVIHRIETMNGDGALIITDQKTGRKFTVTTRNAEREFDVFYGGDGGSVHTGWQGWNQHRTAEATTHREAVLKSLFCNHAPGTRYGVVGTEPGHPNNGRPVLRFFELRKCDENEADWNYDHPCSSGPLKLVEVSL